MAEKCEYCGRTHRSGIATEKWHKAYSFIKREAAKVPHSQQGSKEEFYPAWVLALVATNVRLQLWPILNDAIVERDDFTCQDCGEKFEKTSYGSIKYRWLTAEVHHIVPRGLGGSDHPANLKLICKKCHQKYNEQFNGFIKKANRAKAQKLDAFQLREAGQKGDG